MTAKMRSPIQKIEIKVGHHDNRREYVFIDALCSSLCGRYDMAPQTPTSTAASTASQSKVTPGSPRIIQSGGMKQPVKVVTSAVSCQP